MDHTNYKHCWEDYNLHISSQGTPCLSPDLPINEISLCTDQAGLVHCGHTISQLCCHQESCVKDRTYNSDWLNTNNTSQHGVLHRKYDHRRTHCQGRIHYLAWKTMLSRKVLCCWPLCEPALRLMRVWAVVEKWFDPSLPTTSPVFYVTGR